MAFFITKMHPKRMYENGKSILKIGVFNDNILPFFEILLRTIDNLDSRSVPFFQKLAMVAAKKTEITYTMSAYVFCDLCS